MPDLGDLCGAAVEGARGDEAVEAYAEESRHTEASALRGEIEGLTFAESRGVGVRLIADGLVQGRPALSDRRVVLTRQGRLLADTVVRRLLDV